jgi:hypothetical protein
VKNEIGPSLISYSNVAGDMVGVNVYDVIYSFKQAELTITIFKLY